MRIRYEDIDPSFIKALVTVLLSAHVICWTVCYAISASNGTLQYPNLFLSRAMDSDPSRAFACVLFPIMAGMTGFVLFLRSVLLSRRLETKTQKLVWKIFNACSILITFGMIAVPAVPYSLSTVIHMAAAYTVFVSGFTIMFLSTFLDRSLGLAVAGWVGRIRMTLNIIAFFGFVGFAVFFYIDYFVSSMCEIVAAACMFSFVCSLAHESEFFSKNISDVEAKRIPDLAA